LFILIIINFHTLVQLKNIVVVSPKEVRIYNDGTPWCSYLMMWQRIYYCFLKGIWNIILKIVWIWETRKHLILGQY